MRFALQSAVTKAANFSGTPVIFGPAGAKALKRFRALVITLKVTSAERDTADETYDFYITTGDGTTSWDIVHFLQIATTGAKIYTARVMLDPGFVLGNVTSAVPGVAANDPGTFKTDTAGAGEGIKTLGAGLVRHGPVGDRLSHELVVAGTIVTGIAYSITVEGE